MIWCLICGLIIFCLIVIVVGFGVWVMGKCVVGWRRMGWYSICVLVLIFVFL